MATVIGEVRNSGLFRTRSMPIFQLTVGQGRAKLRCLWFNATYLQDKFKPGADDRALRQGRGRRAQPRAPDYPAAVRNIGRPGDGGDNGAEKKAAESLEIGRIVPIYESTGQGRLTPRWFRRAIRTALDNLTPDSGHDPGGRACPSRPDLAARGALECALARAGRKFPGLAVVAHAGAHPDDL